MSFENYRKIIDEGEKNGLFQVALGGRGDPDMHEQFEKIIRYSAEHHITPNFTTSGLGMTPEKAALCKKYCGAVAVSQYSRLADIVPELAVRRVNDPSKRKVYRTVDDIPVLWTFGDINPDCHWAGDQPGYTINGEHYDWDELHHMYYSDEPQEYEFYRIFNERHDSNTEMPNYTMKAIQMLLDAGVKTNIHYVLGNNSIEEAIDRLSRNDFPKGINAVIFLLHKPAGQGTKGNMLSYEDPRVAAFFAQVDKRHPFKVGMDSCNVPGAIHFCKSILPESLDTCEGGRYSCYIGADMQMVPCSFDQENRYEVSLREMSIVDAWNSEPFERFRDKMRSACPGCEKKALCMGGCPLMPEIVFCNSGKRYVKE